MPSPPGRFSTTTGCLQRVDNLSASSRAEILTPLPAPSVTINRTGRFGQVSAAAHCADMNSGSISDAATIAADGHFAFKEIIIGVLRPPARSVCVLPPERIHQYNSLARSCNRDQAIAFVRSTGENAQNVCSFRGSAELTLRRFSRVAEQNLMSLVSS